MKTHYLKFYNKEMKDIGWVGLPLSVETSEKVIYNLEL